MRAFFGKSALNGDTDRYVEDTMNGVCEILLGLDDGKSFMRCEWLVN